LPLPACRFILVYSRSALSGFGCKRHYGLHILSYLRFAGSCCLLLCSVMGATALLTRFGSLTRYRFCRSLPFTVLRVTVTLCVLPRCRCCVPLASRSADLAFWVPLPQCTVAIQLLPAHRWNAVPLACACSACLPAHLPLRRCSAVYRTCLHVWCHLPPACLLLHGSAFRSPAAHGAPPACTARACARTSFCAVAPLVLTVFCLGRSCRGAVSAVLFCLLPFVCASIICRLAGAHARNFLPRLPFVYLRLPCQPPLARRLLPYAWNAAQVVLPAVFATL